MKKVDLLLDEPCPELLCGICSDILEDPMQVHCPEDHMFCSKCITCHVEQQSNCPICTTPLDKNTFQLSKFVTRQVGRLRIKCAYSDTGCPWQGLLSDQHISECEYQPCTCPNADKGCNVTNLNKSNMEHHLKSCLYQTMTCPNNMPLCQPFLLLELSKHEDQCQSYTCPYANEGCPFIGTLTQVNIHCEGYCGRLHQKINQLEEEVKRLNKLIQDVTIGLNIKLPSTPETALQEDESKKQQQQQQQQQQQGDTSMDEMALFHQMFNSDPFGALDLSATTPTAMDQSTPNHHEDDNTSMMDLGSVLPDINFLELNQSGAHVASPPSHSSSLASNFHNNSNTNKNITLNNNSNNQQVGFNSIFETATSPQPLQFVPPVNVPKRTSNGKKIRYSKNVRLAHNALRIARQRTASNNNPSNDAILNNLDIAKQQMTNGNQIAFKNFQDVAHFLNADAMSPSSNTTSTTSTTSTTTAPSKKSVKAAAAAASSSTSSTTTNTTNTTNTVTAKSTPKKEKKKNATVSSPQYTDSAVSSPPPSTNAPKRRPMFILASSYLSNYNSNNEKV